MKRVLVHQRLVLGSLLADLIAAHLVDGLHQVTHDVELVEDQHGLGRTVLDDVDVGLPHVAANAFERSGFLRPQIVEERLQRLLLSSFTAPHQSLALEVVDVGHVDVTALPRDLVDADVSQTLEVAIRKPVDNRLLDRGGYRPPGAMK